MVELSIIIPTYRRKDSLIRLLGSLKNQLTNKMEIIIVEQGENHSILYQKFMKGSPAALHYRYSDVVSTSKAKNIGAKLAKGNYLIFYDDDVVVQNHAVANIIKNFSDLTIGGVAGRVVDDGKKEENQKTDVGNISLLGMFTDGFSSSIRQDVDTVIGCHAAWQTEVFFQVGEFDERFTGNAMREESDLSLRVKQKGYRIVFDPSATVVHMREPHGGARKADGRLFWYYHFFSNETYFFLKHRPAILLPIFLLTRISYILRCMFGFGREVSWRSVTTPFSGMRNGVEKYLKQVNVLTR